MNPSAHIVATGKLASISVEDAYPIAELAMIAQIQATVLRVKFAAPSAVQAHQ
jgi:hypothetical protein